VSILRHALRARGRTAEGRSLSRILIVAPAWIGDAIISQPLLTLLERRDPRPDIDVLAPPWVAPVYARMPEVSDVIAAPFAHGALALGARRVVGRDLSKRKYTQAIVLPNSLKSALVPWLASIPLRTGFLGEQRYGLLNDRRRLDNVRLPRLVDRFAALAYEPGAALPEPLPDPALRVDAAAQGATLRKLGLSRNLPILALCPGAEYGPAKRWPAPYYAEIAHNAKRGGRQVWIFGSPKDAEVGRAITAAAPHAIDLTGRTNLAEAIDLLALADVVLTNDSGLMHVATAVGCRVVALFGSSTPLYTPPLSPRATTISLKLACSPCFERTCPLGHMNCLNQLKPDRVQDTIAALPKNH
jgi:heptosyltransferase-2